MLAQGALTIAIGVGAWTRSLLCGMNDKTMRKTVLLWMGILQMANGQSAIGKAKQIVRSFPPGLKALQGTENESLCVFVFTPTPDGAYSRMFAPEHGIAEDPATGSSTGPLAAYMIRHNLVSGEAGMRFVSEQGTNMGRRSWLHVEVHGKDAADGIYVGGHVTPVAEAVMTLPSPAARAIER